MKTIKKMSAGTERTRVLIEITDPIENIISFSNSHVRYAGMVRYYLKTNKKIRRILRQIRHYFNAGELPRNDLYNSLNYWLKF